MAPPSGAVRLCSSDSASQENCELVQLLRGQGRRGINDALDEDEVAEGYILTCQGVPDTPSVTVEYE